MSSSASDVVTGKPFGRYVLERPLASGGMGQLFIGIMPGPAGFERRVAIKRILPHLCGSDEFVRRFIDEARIVVQLQHGNIVPVFEMGVEGDEYYIAMEYLPGWDLKAVLQRCREAGSSFPVPLALLLGIEVARGLAYAHRKTDEQGRELSIIHRDVSPSNILLGRDGVVKITDFGIAKAASKMVDSITGMLRGKFGYMSPEQASGNDLDRRSDIFSLGVVLWEVLVGRRLFDAESDTAILRKIQACEVTPPSACRSDVPIEVDVPIMRCLVRDRRQRFSFAEELEQELTALLVRLYTGTGASSLAAFLLDLFPEERRKATPAVGASFDDLLRAGLEQLSEVDVHGPTLDVGPLAARPRPEQSRDEPAGRAGAPSPGSGRETRQAGGLPPAAAGGSLPEIDWTAMSAGAAVPWQVHEPLSTPAIPLPGPVSGSWPSPAGREVTAARQPLSWRWRAAVAGIAAGLLALGAGGAWLAARLSGEGWGSLQVQTRPGGAWVAVDGIPASIESTTSGEWLRIDGIPPDEQRDGYLVTVTWPGYPPVEELVPSLPTRLKGITRPARTSVDEELASAGRTLVPLPAEDVARALFFRQRGLVRSPADLPAAWKEQGRTLLERSAGRTASSRAAVALPTRKGPADRPVVPRGGTAAAAAQAPGKAASVVARGPLGRVKIRCIPFGTIEAGGKTFVDSTGVKGVELPLGPNVISCTNKVDGRKEVTITVKQSPAGAEPPLERIVLRTDADKLEYDRP